MMIPLRAFILVPIVFVIATVARVAIGRPAPAIIPLPASLTKDEGGFRLSGEVRIICADAALEDVAVELATRLRRPTGFPLEVVSGETGDGDIVLASAGADASLGDEGYTLSVTARGVTIRAAQPVGAYYGVQSLLQLLPAEVFSGERQSGVDWVVPAVRIEDKPRFGWRGLMLDVGRHYQSVADIKRLLDVMALLKFNIFHWHLTEDQGWRLEIKKYPRLTEVGAWRDSTPPYGDRKGSDGKRYGGFYTQEEARDIVAYAAARHITVVPEIEMPGHASAAIASYPKLGNTDVPGYAPKVSSHWGVHHYTYAPKEETFRFIEDVLDEVCAIFPSTFIHIGGDEAPKDQWKQSAFAQEVMAREGLKDEDELQSWFIRRVEKMLAARGRRLVGWDEIQEGGLPKTATMMVWRDVKWARHALNLGNDVVMATTSNTYLDYYQAPPAAELAKGVQYEAIGGYLPIETVYAYDPAFVAESAEQEKRILGTQGQLWGEYFKDAWKVEYMAFPRACALAEVAWSPQAARSFDDFRRRLEPMFARFDQLGVAYHRSNSELIGSWHSRNADSLEWEITDHLAGPGVYDVAFSALRGVGAMELDAVALFAGEKEVSRDTHRAVISTRRSRDPCFTVELPARRPGVRYTLRAYGKVDAATELEGIVKWAKRSEK